MASLLFVIDNKYIVLFYDIIKWKKERKKMLDICLLGTGGMMPMPNRFLTAMLARLNGRLLLIDCGEGTQVSMKLLGWGFKTIDVICFTHFHADHISGLPGILLTIGNAGRTEPLTLIGGVGLQYIVEGLKRIAPELPFDLNYIELNEDTPNPIEINGFRISYVLADHMVRCYAYKIDVLRKGKFDLKRAQQQNIPKVIWSKLQKEGNAVWEGKQYTADMVMGADTAGRGEENFRPAAAGFSQVWVRRDLYHFQKRSLAYEGSNAQRQSQGERQYRDCAAGNGESIQGRGCRDRDDPCRQ